MIPVQTLTVRDTLVTVWERFAGAVTSFHSVKDAIDILLVAMLIYALIISLRRSQSIQILKGLALLVVFYLIVNVFEMNASKFILQRVFGNILVILVVIFSGEIRQILERVGHRNLSLHALFTSRGDNREDVYNMINDVCRACSDMSRDHIGSLMVFQRRSYLGDLTKKAVKLDSLVSEDMLESVFFPNAALHDGAIVIDGNRIVAARCIVPLQNEKEVTEHVGTRHRAAIEISRTSDAVAVVTSEETGIISIAVEGMLERGLTDADLRQRLVDLLVETTPEAQTKKAKSIFRRNKRSGGDEDA